MPGLLRKLLGFIILVVTIGLATCQSMLKAEPVDANYAPENFLTNSAQVR